MDELYKTLKNKKITGVMTSRTRTSGRYSHLTLHNLVLVLGKDIVSFEAPDGGPIIVRKEGEGMISED